MNALDAAYDVLRNEGGALHYRALTEKILAQGLWHSKAKSPWRTINARLAVDIKAREGASRFRRTAPGFFAINDAQSQAAEFRPARLAAATRAAGSMSFLDAAEHVLREHDFAPLHYTVITELAMSQGLISPEGSTPATSLSAMIGTDIRRREARGEQPRFMRLGGGMIGLTEPVPPSLAAEIEEHNREVRRGLLALLGQVAPDEFEALIEVLLAALGFEEVERTRLSGDGGIDVRGTLVVGDVVRIRMAVQAKRWKNNVQRPEVQKVRGSLGAHEQGLIITTSDFSKSAREEAGRVDASPVALMNGQQLAALLAANEIGTSHTEYRLLSLDDTVEAELAATLSEWDSAEDEAASRGL